MTHLFELPPETKPVGKPKTGKQAEILEFVRKQNRPVQRKEIVDAFGKYYHHGASVYANTVF